MEQHEGRGNPAFVVLARDWASRRWKFADVRRLQLKIVQHDAACSDRCGGAHR
jgi:hypothetical protein